MSVTVQCANNRNKPVAIEMSKSGRNDENCRVQFKNFYQAKIVYQEC